MRRWLEGPWLVSVFGGFGGWVYLAKKEQASSHHRTRFNFSAKEDHIVLQSVAFLHVQRLDDSAEVIEHVNGSTLRSLGPTGELRHPAR